MLVVIFNKKYYPIGIYIDNASYKFSKHEKQN